MRTHSVGSLQCSQGQHAFFLFMKIVFLLLKFMLSSRETHNNDKGVSSQQKTKFAIILNNYNKQLDMNQKHLLCFQWAVWVGFHSNQEQKINQASSESIKHLHTLRSYHDLLYFWKESPLSHPSNFFVRSGKYGDTNEWETYLEILFSYEIDGKYRNINAINYFKLGIHPSLPDPKNAQGGRIIFQIEKNMQRYEQAYQWIIFHFLGSSQQQLKGINGVRIISPKFDKQFIYHYIVQIWVDFNKGHIEKMHLLLNTLKSFSQKFQIHNFNPYFIQNSSS